MTGRARHRGAGLGAVGHGEPKGGETRAPEVPESGRRGGCCLEGSRPEWGRGTHFNNLLLLFLLRLFAAPGLSLFFRGHCGDRWYRPDLSADGYCRGIWHHGRRRKTRPPSLPQRTESKSLIRRRNAAFATGRCRRALWVARSGARKRICACASAAPGQEGAGTGRGKMIPRHTRCRAPPGPLLACSPHGDEFVS
jgi:hypothetical protein